MKPTTNGAGWLQTRALPVQCSEFGRMRKATAVPHGTHYRRGFGDEAKLFPLYFGGSVRRQLIVYQAAIRGENIMLKRSTKSILRAAGCSYVMHLVIVAFSGVTRAQSQNPANPTPITSTTVDGQ